MDFGAHPWHRKGRNDSEDGTLWRIKNHSWCTTRTVVIIPSPRLFILTWTGEPLLAGLGEALFGLLRKVFLQISNLDLATKILLPHV